MRNHGLVRVPLSLVFRINTASVFPAQSPSETFTHYSIPAFDQSGGAALELGIAIESNKTRIYEPSILVSKLNPRKPRVVAVLNPHDNTCCSTEFICYVPIRGHDDLRYWAAYLGSSAFSGRLERVAVGSTNSHTRATPSETLKWLVPDVPQLEQKQIADILDAVDDAIIETDAVIEKLLAVRIGLTEDLLTFGITETGRPRSPEGVVETKLGPVPVSWSRGTLGSLAASVTSGSRGWAKYYSETGAKFLRIGNLTRQHINLRYDDLVYVTPPKGQEGSRTAVQENDLLISITADLGIIGSIPPDFGEAYVNQHIALVRLKEAEVNPRWPAHFLSSRRSQILFQKLNDQGAKAGINLPAVSQIELPLPTRDEQDAIVERFDAADEAVARHRIERDKLAALRFGLRDHLLTGRKPVVVLREAAE